MWKVVWMVAAFVGKPCSMLQQDAYYSVQIQSEQPICVVGSVEQQTLMRDFKTEKEAREFVDAAPKGIKFQILPPADQLNRNHRKIREDRAAEMKARRHRKREKPEIPTPTPAPAVEE